MKFYTHGTITSRNEFLNSSSFEKYILMYEELQVQPFSLHPIVKRLASEDQYERRSILNQLETLRTISLLDHVS